VLLLLLLLDLDEFDRCHEKPIGCGNMPLFFQSQWEGVMERIDVRGGETTARASEKDLAEGWLDILRVRVIVVIVPQVGSGLEL
jgi:hypothetical protein